VIGILPLTIFVAVYLIGFEKPKIHDGLGLSAFNILSFTSFLLTILGGFSHNITIAMTIGLTFICVYLILLWFDAPRKAPACFTFSSYLFLCLLSITLSRGMLGLNAAYSPRYQIFSWLLLVSLSLSTLKVFPKLQSMTSVHIFMLFFICLLYLSVIPSSIRSLQSEHLLFKKDMHQWSKNQKLHNFPVEYRRYYSNLLKSVIEKGLYNFPLNEKQSNPQYKE